MESPPTYNRSGSTNIPSSPKESRGKILTIFIILSSLIYFHMLIRNYNSIFIDIFSITGFIVSTFRVLLLIGLWFLNKKAAYFFLSLSVIALIVESIHNLFFDTSIYLIPQNQTWIFIGLAILLSLGEVALEFWIITRKWKAFN